MPTPTEPEWGLTSEIRTALRERSPVAWGARAIWSRGQAPDLLHDRQGCCVPEWAQTKANKQKQAFAQLINGYRLEKAWEELSKLSIDGRSTDVVTLYDDPIITLKASPNGSCGYLYIGAWVKPCDPDGKWSGNGAVPCVGDEVYVPMVKSTVQVLALAVQAEYLGFAGHIHHKPEWLVRQQVGDRQDGFFFGIDIDYNHKRKAG